MEAAQLWTFSVFFFGPIIAMVALMELDQPRPKAAAVVAALTPVLWVAMLATPLGKMVAETIYWALQLRMWPFMIAVLCGAALYVFVEVLSMFHGGKPRAWVEVVAFAPGAWTVLCLAFTATQMVVATITAEPPPFR